MHIYGSKISKQESNHGQKNKILNLKMCSSQCVPSNSQDGYLKTSLYAKKGIIEQLWVNWELRVFFIRKLIIGGSDFLKFFIQINALYDIGSNFENQESTKLHSIELNL